MHINLLFFGITTDFVGSNSLEFDVAKNTTVLNLKEILILKYPQLKNINSYAIAVNESYAEDNYCIQKNDIIAIIPPVSGG